MSNENRPYTVGELTLYPSIITIRVRAPIGTTIKPQLKRGNSAARPRFFFYTSGRALLFFGPSLRYSDILAGMWFHLLTLGSQNENGSSFNFLLYFPNIPVYKMSVLLSSALCQFVVSCACTKPLGSRRTFGIIDTGVAGGQLASTRPVFPIDASTGKIRKTRFEPRSNRQCKSREMTLTLSQIIEILTEY